jgi:hypothetical protein
LNGDPIPLVDIDEFADLALAHDVTAVPTVVGVKNGKRPRECTHLQDVRSRVVDPDPH